jgi:hypothetical protein
LATQRYISTSFWDDSWVHKLDPSEKLLFLYLMTNPLTNIAGIYKLSIDRIVFDTGFNGHTVHHILEKFMKAGKVATEGEYIIIPSWPKHQKVAESPKIRTGIEMLLSGTPQIVLFVARESGYHFPLDDYLIGYTYPSNYSDSDLDFDLDSDRDSEKREEPAQNPKPGKKPSEAKAPDPLYKPILDSFLSQGNFANYAKEGTCIKALIKSIRNLTPDDAENTARKILETFRTLTNGNDKFWKDCPFLPSALSPRLEQVWTIAKKGSAAPSMDWFDELEKQHKARMQA